MAALRGVVVLGSTGSIGRQAIEVLAAYPDRFQVVALAAHSDADLMTEQLRRTGAQLACMTDPGAAAALQKRTGRPVRVLTGAGGLEELARLEGADIVLNSVVGSVGLRASLATLEAGKRLALANKESLVSGGDLVKSALAGGGELLPVDSEHSAIHQCLAAGRAEEVKRLILTASGGPFRGRRPESLAHVTLRETLAHPTWTMGPKITVDSATLMNKGLEVIEAHHLFGVAYDDIEVVVHPQSVIHSMVEYSDGAILAQLSSPDMRLPIAYALNHPERLGPAWTETDLPALGRFDFERPDPGIYPCLELAYSAGRAGGTAPAVLNAANEIAVQAFIRGGIRLPEIAQLVADVLRGHVVREVTSIDDVEEAEREAREAAAGLVNGG
ncbi:MAG: 1-deoxy-D-xylulose-5-phosphate reductoisomerase [Candidatus Geothermincolia bacterium]